MEKIFSWLKYKLSKIPHPGLVLFTIIVLGPVICGVFWFINISNLKECLKGIQHPWTVLSTNVFFAIIAICIVWLAINFGEQKRAYRLNLVCCLFGVLLGWMAGILASPFEEGEKIQFSKYLQALSAFLSGYLVSKFDRIFEKGIGNNKIFSQPVLLRIVLFIMSFILMMLTVFQNRKYFDISSSIN